MTATEAAREIVRKCSTNAPSAKLSRHAQNRLLDWLYSAEKLLRSFAELKRLRDCGECVCGLSGVHLWHCYSIILIIIICAVLQMYVRTSGCIGTNRERVQLRAELRAALRRDRPERRLEPDRSGEAVPRVPRGGGVAVRVGEDAPDSTRRGGALVPQAADAPRHVPRPRHRAGRLPVLSSPVLSCPLLS